MPCLNLPATIITAATKFPPTAGSMAILAACAVAVSGVIPAYSHSRVEGIVRELGGIVTKSVTRTTTHLITTDHDYKGRATKVKEALSRNLPIVNLDWLLESKAKGALQNEAGYALTDSTPQSPASPATPKRKRNHASVSLSPGLSKKPRISPDPVRLGLPQLTKSPVLKAARPKPDDNSDPPKTKDKTDSPKTGNKPDSPNPDDEKPKGSKAKPSKPEPLANGQISKSDLLVVPLDNPAVFVNGKVYIDPNGLIYDASLNQTNAQNNNNKFYRLQVVQEQNGQFTTWARWGRVGEWGQSNTYSDNVDMCIREFNKKFRSKSGYPFPETGPPKPGKYVFVERSYEPDDDEEEAAKSSKATKPSDDEEVNESSLEKPIQQLMELIFNKAYFSNAMESMNYDANKLPLGKLSKNTITRGFSLLKQLGATINDQDQYRQELNMTKHDAIAYLSNSYYSVIPHAFGRNRPPVIHNGPMLKKEIELLESLSDMKAAEDIMKLASATGKINMLDQQFQALNLQSIDILDHQSSEFTALSKYLDTSRGATHHLSYTIQDIFRIERPGEKDRIDTLPFSTGSQSNRRLLWHGSRSTNYAGILSQGLRIAPPEAPVSGYMFGKGIYLADMSSKSANYCYSQSSGGYALLLLCEAELGEMQELTHADYDADKSAASSGKGSTWGRGNTGPLEWKDAGCVHPSLKGISMPNPDFAPGPTNVPNATLYYNEYIAYNVSQVRLRYLFRVSMKY